MEVNRVSFSGKLVQTKKGNTYEKTNTGKRIGTAAGLVGGTVAASTGCVQLLAAITGAKFFKGNKAVAATYALLAAGVAAVTLAGRAIGAIPDAIINNARKAKADNKTSETTKA